MLLELFAHQGAVGESLRVGRGTAPGEAAADKSHVEPFARPGPLIEFAKIAHKE